MTVDVDVTDATGFVADHEAVRRLIQAVLEAERIAGEVDVAFVGEAAIAALNERFRDADGATDVLSFDYAAEDDWPGGAAAGGAERRVAGEIVVCPRVVLRYAVEDERDPAGQLGWTLIHGALHLAGYDHETDRGEMREREQVLLGCLANEVQALSLSTRGE
jgi:probable rRNA maturation factor